MRQYIYIQLRHFEITYSETACLITPRNTGIKSEYLRFVYYL